MNARITQGYATSAAGIPKLASKVAKCICGLCWSTINNPHERAF